MISLYFWNKKKALKIIPLFKGWKLIKEESDWEYAKRIAGIKEIRLNLRKCEDGNRRKESKIMKCKFDKAWVGECGKETFDDNPYCSDHMKVRCVICGEQATHTCTWASSISCGAPLCNSKKCADKHHEGHDKMAEDTRKKLNPTVDDIKDRGLEIIKKEKEKAVMMAKDIGVGNKIVKDQCSRALSKVTFLHEIGLITQKELLEIAEDITTQVFEDSIYELCLVAKRGRDKDGR